MNTARFPQISIALAALSISVLLSIAACNADKSETATAPPQGKSGADHSQMQKNCDMQSMDMSKMSAEKQKQMMDDCKKP